MMLTEIIANKRAELLHALDRPSVRELEQRAASRTPARSLFEALQTSAATPPPTRIIAEVKRRSPSLGVIRDVDPVAQARCYAAGGAAAISVLTDAHYFGGSLADLAAVSNADLGLPVLRKDFIVDERQILETRANGGDALLLIVAALDPHQLAAFLTQAQEFGMDALVEVHSSSELAIALEAGAQIIGINNRNLHTFETTLETTIELAASVPNDRIIVSESGVASPADVALLRSHGVNAFLIGQALMRTKDPEALLKELQRT